MIPIVAAALLSAVACGNYGKVEQGRAVAFDKQNGVVTLILDSAPQSDQPRYDVLPPVKVKVPQNANEMGASPDAGKMLYTNFDKREIVIFDPEAVAIKTVSYTVVERFDKVTRDDPRVAKTKFPSVDRQKKTVTIYSRRYKILLTFAVADEYLVLPDNTWKPGDEVRYYYKQPGQALRMMNVSKTDLSKAGK
jgi:hypothetical protein